MRNIFAHKINQNGDLLWDAKHFAVVTNLPGRQKIHVSITDGSGGVYIAWVDYRFDAKEIFLFNTWITMAIFSWMKMELHLLRFLQTNLD